MADDILSAASEELSDFLTSEEEEDETDEVVEDDDEEADENGIQSMDFGFDPENIDEDPLSRTYAMDFVHKRVKGYVDDKQAVMQAIWKALSTVRYANYIYDDDYGCDIMNRIQNSSLTQAYLDTDVPAMVKEALLQDDRITDVKDFSWERTGSDGVYVSFTAETIYGDLAISGEV